MTGEELYEALTDVDPTYILSAAPMESRSRKNRIQRWSALAACLCLVVTIVGMGMWWISLGNAVYSAYDAASLFGAVNDAAIKNYTKVSAPDGNLLYLNNNRIPYKLEVYRYCGSGTELDENEFRTFADGCLPKAAQLIGFNLTEYEIERDKYAIGYHFLSISQDSKIKNEYAYSINAWQYEGFHRVSFFTYHDYQLFFNGEGLQIDQRQSDEQMIASLENARDLLFETFDVSFKDVKLIRNYDSDSEYGATSIDIYFYNEEDHKLNRYLEQPASDCIILSFDNYANSSDELCSDSVLTKASVNYIKHRSNAKKAFQIDGKTRTLSLREAEELLANGYVFDNGHVCRLCMEAQEAISFEDYDHVSLTYLSFQGYAPPFLKKDSLIMPFYAFYKEIGVGKNGNIIYARTYVPAIHLEDMEEYFAEQQKKHPQ